MEAGEEAHAALYTCPNRLCGKVIGIGFLASEPLCVVFCGSCHAEIEFPNPYYSFPDDATSSEEEWGEER